MSRAQDAAASPDSAAYPADLATVRETADTTTPPACPDARKTMKTKATSPANGAEGRQVRCRGTDAFPASPHRRPLGSAPHRPLSAPHRHRIGAVGPALLGGCQHRAALSARRARPRRQRPLSLTRAAVTVPAQKAVGLENLGHGWCVLRQAVRALAPAQGRDPAKVAYPTHRGGRPPARPEIRVPVIALQRGARVIATAGATYADALRGLDADVTGYGEGMAERVRELAGGPVDLALDTAPLSDSLPEVVRTVKKTSGATPWSAAAIRSNNPAAWRTRFDELAGRYHATIHSAAIDLRLRADF